MIETDTIIKWFEVAFLVLFGAFLLSKSRNIFSADGLITCTTMPEYGRERILQAIERRDTLEALPNLGPLYAVAGIVLAIAVAVNVLSPQMSYALFVSVIATALFWLYSHVRRPAYAHRAAILAPRKRLSVAPWYYVVTLASVGCLFVGRQGRINYSDALVIVASLSMLAFALLIGRLPALLTGEDSQAEHYVDERLRHKRAMVMLYYAGATLFVYETWELIHVHTAASDLSRGIVLVLWLAVAFSSAKESRTVVDMRPSNG